jgi:SAM-dependent methyltransferase
MIKGEKDIDNLNYWENPGDNNSAENYLDNPKTTEWSKHLLEVIKKYAKPTDTILEIGCNVGRNLNHFYQNGFKKITGIEISEIAVKLGESAYPELKGKIIVSSIEDKIKDLKKYDIIFTRAVLEHIMIKSEWIFPEIERITKRYLITIEDEKSLTWKHYPRNYKEVFKNLKQIEEKDLQPEIPNFILRVFKK